MTIRTTVINTNGSLRISCFSTYIHIHVYIYIYIYITCYVYIYIYICNIGTFWVLPLTYFCIPQKCESRRKRKRGVGKWAGTSSRGVSSRDRAFTLHSIALQLRSGRRWNARGEEQTRRGGRVNSGRWFRKHRHQRAVEVHTQRCTLRL